ncbi:hypothetical protein [Glycomyces algeriensis]|uniref:Ig-like domain-containing protein n=1 Tax=Glycomyces algeriensis TaxID=256037 RepID=A0A9W6G597_9ACTN|nr:hypothetical protein [Glycomyces algeriensis]MDA1367569.1 hypothetical protein [Glycomyces algeriensis]MDR7353068.1 hypothetical protein [Glycomyces algeriensis]GLI40761.1 hypothetical protein GALLR39Z86_06110 [Glycomyces algeriensis]
MDHPHRSGSRKHLTIAAVLALAGALAACDLDAVSGTGNGADAGVFYALGDDHRLYRWDPGAGAEEGVDPVLDLSGVWEEEGDVGTVYRASLSVDPTGRHAAWVAGSTPAASLKFGDLETGEITTAVEYPVDHACIDPVWLPDGSAVLAHRASVWGDVADTGDAIPFPVTTWGATEWHSPDAGQLPTTVELGPKGCRLRWYTAEDGSAQALYHDLELSELYRIDANGQVLETIPVSSLQGAAPLTIGLVNVDPAGRYACVVEDYATDGATKGGFTIRAESGTRVVDLASGEAIGPDEAGCTTLHEDGFVSRSDSDVAFIDYDGNSQWSTELPGPIVESPLLYFIPDGP